MKPEKSLVLNQLNTDTMTKLQGENMNKKKETYIAALYGVTPEQQQELRRTMERVWSYIYYDVNIDPSYSELEQMVELTLDANRLIDIGDIGNWWRDVEHKMLVGFDIMDCEPDSFWKSIAENNNIEMWTLRD